MEVGGDQAVLREDGFALAGEALATGEERWLEGCFQERMVEGMAAQFAVAAGQGLEAKANQLAGHFRLAGE